MKRFLLVFAFLSIAVNINSQWYMQTSGTQNTLRSVFFINKNTGWICGFECVLKTTDCGNTWTSSYLEGYHRSIFFTSGSQGWICGDNGRIYRTANGGNNWISVNSGVSSSLNQITFSDENTGLVAGSNNKILKTTDSGITWKNINHLNAVIDFHSVKILDTEHYIITGTESSIYTSSNAGTIWDSLSLGMPNPLLTVEFTDRNTGWVSGCCGMFMKTTDGGSEWSPEVYLTPGFSINSIDFLNPNTGWIVGDAGYILRTTNSGVLWDSLNSLTHSGLYSVCFINKDTGFVVGYSGLILRTANGGGKGYPLNVKQMSAEFPEKYSLAQNFPNPFNPVTVILYSLRKNSFVNLKVFDLTGKEVAELVNKKQNSGTYKVDFNGEGLSSGIYFYVFTSDSYSDTKKMILLR